MQNSKKNEKLKKKLKSPKNMKNSKKQEKTLKIQILNGNIHLLLDEIGKDIRERTYRLGHLFVGEFGLFCQFNQRSAIHFTFGRCFLFR